MDLTSLQFKPLDKTQIPLVNRFYKQVYKKGIAKKSDQVFILQTSEQGIVCAARIKQVEEAQLLTGVATKVEVRKKGLAKRLLKNMLLQQSQTLYCFPYPCLQHFYEQVGFSGCSTHDLPTALAQQYLRYNARKPLLIMRFQIS